LFCSKTNGIKGLVLERFIVALKQDLVPFRILQ